MAGESLGYVSVEVRANIADAQAKIATLRKEFGSLNAAGLAGGAMGSAAAASRSGIGAWAAVASSKMLSLSSSLNKAGRAMYSTGRAMSWRLTTPLALLGTTAVKAANSFEMAFARIEGLAGDIGVSMEDAKRQVKELAMAYGRDPQELAEGLYFIASAGVDADVAMSVLKESARGAAAQLADTQTIAQMLTTVMNNYGKSGMTAAGALEVLTQAVKLGKAEPQEFADSLGAVIPMASQLGVSFASMAGAVAQGTNAGLSAARAATGLRFILGSLQRPTDSAKEVLKNYGLSVEDLQKKFKNLGATGGIQYLADLFDTTTTKGKEAFAILMGGQRGLIIANALIGENLQNAKRIDSIMKGAIGSGIVDDALAKTQKTQAQRFRELMAQMKVFAIELGEEIVPILLDDVLPVIRQLLDAFKALSDEGTKRLVVGGIFLALMGPALSLLGVVTRLIAGISWLGGTGLRLVLAATGASTAATTGGAAAAAGAAGAAGAAAAGTAIGSVVAPLLVAAIATGLAAAVRKIKIVQTKNDLKDPSLAPIDTGVTVGARPKTEPPPRATTGNAALAFSNAFTKPAAEIGVEEFRKEREKLVRRFKIRDPIMEDYAKQLVKQSGWTDEQANRIATAIDLMAEMGDTMDREERKRIKNILAQEDTTTALYWLEKYASQAASALQSLAGMTYGLFGVGRIADGKVKGADPNRFSMVRGLAEHGAVIGLAGGGYLVTRPTFIRGNVLTGEQRKKEAVIPLEDVRGKRILAGAMAEAMGTASGGTVVVNVAGKVERPEDIRRELDWWMRSRGL